MFGTTKGDAETTNELAEAIETMEGKKWIEMGVSRYWLWYQVWNKGCFVLHFEWLQWDKALSINTGL
jgi:hypothetical protein